MKFKDGLNHRIAIYVPSTKNISEQTNNSKVLADTQVKMAMIFGGSTTYKTIGCYQANNGKVVKEKIDIVYSNCNDINDQNTDKVYEIAEHIKQAMSQESVSVEIDNVLYFV